MSATRLLGAALALSMIALTVAARSYYFGKLPSGRATPCIDG